MQNEKSEKLLGVAVMKSKMIADEKKLHDYNVCSPKLISGIVPDGVVAPVMAIDYSRYEISNETYGLSGGFPGFAYLSKLSTRAEYRAFASAISTELTRKWITVTSKQDDGNSGNEEILKIEEEIKRLGLREVIQRAAEHDCYFGRAQIFIDIGDSDRKTPLIPDQRTIKKGSLRRVSTVEAIWTTPSAYNSTDPSAPDFYKPSSWYMLGNEIHSSRLMTIVTRQLPDILKPAFNFSGMSLSQLAEPYVDNWLRTRQSVSDLINNFSITALATSMDQVLQGDDDGSDLIKRSELFAALKSNRGLMLIDKNMEELLQINTPLSGLHELQAQSQEHMCSVSRLPSIILTGISPSGLNASSDGEIRAFYDWVSAQQEAYWRAPIETILKIIQISLFGKINPDIGFSFVPLYQLDEFQKSEVRLKNSQIAVSYIDSGVLDPSEERERLASDPDSGYKGIDIDAIMSQPDIEM